MKKVEPMRFVITDISRREGLESDRPKRNSFYKDSFGAESRAEKISADEVGKRWLIAVCRRFILVSESMPRPGIVSRV